jgi:hypothetical protein
VQFEYSTGAVAGTPSTHPVLAWLLQDSAGSAGQQQQCREGRVSPPVKPYVATSRRVSRPIELTEKPRSCSTEAKPAVTCRSVSAGGIASSRAATRASKHVCHQFVVRAAWWVLVPDVLSSARKHAPDWKSVPHVKEQTFASGLSAPGGCCCA